MQNFLKSCGLRAQNFERKVALVSIKQNGSRDASRSQGRCPGNRDTLLESQRMRDGGGAIYRRKGNGVSNPTSHKTPRTKKVFHPCAPSTVSRSGTLRCAAYFLFSRTLGGMFCQVSWDLDCARRFHGEGASASVFLRRRPRAGCRVMPRFP